MAWLRHNFIQSEVNATCKNQLSCCRQVWFVIGKTHNVAIQLVLQKCGKIIYSGCCPFLFLLYLYTLSLFWTQNLHCLCVWTPSSDLKCTSLNWRQGWSDSSLNFIRLLRVVITPSVAERRKRLEAIGWNSAEFDSYIGKLCPSLDCYSDLSWCESVWETGPRNSSGILDFSRLCWNFWDIIKPLQISTSLTCHYLSIVAEVETLM